MAGQDPGHRSTRQGKPPICSHNADEIPDEMVRSRRANADERIPKQLLCGDLAEGKRSYGDQNKQFKDCLKVSLKAFDIDTASWETLAHDRSPWRSAIQNGSQPAEVRRTAEAQKKCELRKTRAASTGSSAPDTCLPYVWKYFSCSHWPHLPSPNTPYTVNYLGMSTVLIDYDGRTTTCNIVHGNTT